MMKFISDEDAVVDSVNAPFCLESNPVLSEAYSEINEPILKIKQQLVHEKNKSHQLKSEKEELNSKYQKYAIKNLQLSNHIVLYYKITVLYN